MARFTHNSMSIGVHSEVQVQMAKTVVKVYRGVLLEKNDVIIYFLPALQKATAWISLAQPAIVAQRWFSFTHVRCLPTTLMVSTATGFTQKGRTP